jgi:cytochrome c-type biogenesis protein CcmH/NrfG
MWLQVHRYGDARNAYVSATDREPRDARAWLGLARAEARLGNVPESIDAYRTFVQRWNTDVPDSQELAEARTALAEERR